MCCSSNRKLMQSGTGYCILSKCKVSEARLLGFETTLVCCLMNFIFLYLSFFIYRIGIIIVIVSQGWGKGLNELIHVNHLKYEPGIKTSLHMYYPYYKGGSNWYIWQFTDPLWLLPLQMVKVRVKSLSRVQLFATPWTIANQVPPSMGLSRQAYWSGLSFPSPGNLPKPGIEPGSPTVGRRFTVWATRVSHFKWWVNANLSCWQGDFPTIVSGTKMSPNLLFFCVVCLLFLSFYYLWI